MSSQIDFDVRRAASTPWVQASSPVMRWAILGAVALAFILFVLGRWVFIGNAVPTPPGADPLPEASRLIILWVQWIAMLLGSAALFEASDQV